LRPRPQEPELPEHVIHEELQILGVVKVEEVTQRLPGFRIFDLDDAGTTGEREQGSRGRELHLFRLVRQGAAFHPNVPSERSFEGKP
jgi:hypothetical protein